MTAQRTNLSKEITSRFILALHSSHETFGISVLDLNEPIKSVRSSTFQIGRLLSNNLLTCVEDLLPAKSWAKLSRIAVATGPGSFTSTRLTVVMARTIAQQINCSLDGVSSFALMAPRLAKQLDSEQLQKPFWIAQKLKRRGIVAGLYHLKNSPKTIQQRFLEITPPHLIPEGLNIQPVLSAQEDVRSDVEYLLKISL